MKKKQVVKAVETLDVEIVSNGLVLNYSGKKTTEPGLTKKIFFVDWSLTDEGDDWTTTKEIVADLEALHCRIDKIVNEMS